MLSAPVKMSKFIKRMFDNILCYLGGAYCLNIVKGFWKKAIQYNLHLGKSDGTSTKR